ncbi:MAG: exodeoxyribonuclease large subunit [Pseudomonadota bacterium]|nr:exodeoxyribonuclease large subunit [Pseudomonadota bacterium]
MQNERTIYTVSELNLTIRTLLESEFPLLWVEGEISNFSQPASGHLYFTLKDSHAQVRCAMFKNRGQYLRFKPANGMQVLIRARVGLYEARGEFQLVAEHMEEAGAGALQRAFNELKAKLSAQGLFDAARKKNIPSLPQKIGVITSPTGAAIRDVLSILQRRFPAIPVLIYPVPVQGEGSAQKIAAALKLASQRRDCDVLLLVRGGGSLEDLWSFNEEIVARAIVASDIPVVCGVGHETDVTIADFAADMRAPTPSAAAELVSPDQMRYVQAFIRHEQRLQQKMRSKLQQLAQQLDWLKQGLQRQHPLNRIAWQTHALNDLTKKLVQNWRYFLARQQHQLQRLTSRLDGASPQPHITQAAQQLAALEHRLIRSLPQQITNKRQQLATLGRTLHAISPLQTLGRGYAMASDCQGKLLTDSRQVAPGDAITLRLHRGQLAATIDEVTNDPGNEHA